MKKVLYIFKNKKLKERVFDEISLIKFKYLVTL